MRGGTALALALLLRPSAGALVSMRGPPVPACRDYAADLNTLFPTDPGTELLAVCAATPAPPGVPTNPWQDSAGVIYAWADGNGTGPEHALAAAFEGAAGDPAANWTTARVRALEGSVNRSSALCPCAAPFRCTGAVGNTSTCEPEPLPPMEMCFDGASATCETLIAAGAGAAVGVLLALAGELARNQPAP